MTAGAQRLIQGSLSFRESTPHAAPSLPHARGARTKCLSPPFPQHTPTAPPASPGTVSPAAALAGRRKGPTNCRSRGTMAAAAADKTLHLMRHGVTEMNVYLGSTRHPYGTPGFKDPLLFDTQLTARGQAQAAAAARQVARLTPQPELLVVSPLSRALHTASLAFGAPPGCAAVVVQPLARERLYLSSDIGRYRAQLAAEFPHFQPALSHLPDGVWWHTADPHDPLAVHEEPEDVFLQRMEQLRSWLAARPERSVAVVAHWGVLQALTGQDFNNCQLHTLRLSQLRRRIAPAAT